MNKYWKYNLDLMWVRMRLIQKKIYTLLKNSSRFYKIHGAFDAFSRKKQRKEI